MWLRTDASVWTRADQFELLMSFAATLAQDLFRAGRLRSTAIDANRPVAARRVADLESFLDRLAEALPLPAPPGGAAPEAGQGRIRMNLLTFEPDGARGVAAFINGSKVAAT
jgi:hypothetical protein